MAGQTRREFFQASAAMLTPVAFGLFNQSCGPSLKEVNKDAASIRYDCNPILPIPAAGCFTGTNIQDLIWTVKLFPKTYGLNPAFNAPGSGTYSALNSFFRTEDAKYLIDNGVIPVIRYATSPFDVGYRPVIEGKHDDDFRRFARRVAAFGKPIVLIPWQCPDEPYHSGGKRVWGWSGQPAEEYKAAWVRMYDIMKMEGANNNTIWSTKCISNVWPGCAMLDPFDFLPGNDYVDIIGWNLNSRIDLPDVRFDTSFSGEFSANYKKAALKYPAKPQMFWEIGAGNCGWQAAWFDKALTAIREDFPRVKAIMFDAHPSHGYNPIHTPETQQVIRKHFASGYFIGSAIEKYGGT